jgi:hypothetical protein
MQEEKRNKIVNVCFINGGSIALLPTVNRFAMWWQSVLHQPKFITKVEYCSFVQHLIVSHHIANLMLAVHASVSL